MTQQVLGYVFLWGIGILAIFAFAIGIEKMIKVILGNYILALVCLAAGQSLDLLIPLIQNPDIAKFLSEGHSGILIFLYLGLLFLLYHKSTIRIKLPEDDIVQKSLYLLLVPLTILSMIFTFQIVLMGSSIFVPAQLQQFALFLEKNSLWYQIVVLTPLRICIHGILTIIISSELKITLKTNTD